MVAMVKIIPNFTTCRPYHDSRNKENCRKSPNCFVSFRQSSRTRFPSSNLKVSCGSVSIFSLVTETANDVSMGHEDAKICKLCKVGDLKNAMKLFTRSDKSKLELSTYCSILQLCAENNSLQDGKMVHSIVSSNGMPIKGDFGAKLVFMYGSCGDLREGRKIFDQILNDKVFLWNFMIYEYAKIENYRESLYLFKKMQRLGIQGNSYTFSCILKCFAALRKGGECKRLHGHIYKLGLGSSNAVVNSLIACYFKCGRVESAYKLFDELGDRDVISWNSMISGCVLNGFSERGLHVFTQMLNLRIDVDLATMVNALVACANIGNLSLGRELHAYGVKTCFGREIMFNNTLLDMYSKCGNLDGAVQVFEMIGQTTVISWTSMIAAFVREGLYENAVSLFYQMEREGVKPDVYTVTSILHACACSSSLVKGRDVHNYIKKNIGLSLSLSNALMDMYAKCGSMKEARLVFSHMPVKDVVSWNTMIGGYSKNFIPNEALKLFAEMQKKLKPDGITMACVLPACGSLAALERGREIHGHTLRNGYVSDLRVANALLDMYVKCGSLVLAQLLFDMIPKKDLISWTIMIAGYGMHGFGNEAIATFYKMRSEGIQPDEISFTCILYACSHSGLLNEGWQFSNSMRSEFNIEAKLEHYACMVDLLARIGNLSEAYRFIETMPIEPDATVWGTLLCGCRIHHDVELAEKMAEHVFCLEPENTGYYVLLANIYAEAEKWEEAKKLREKISKDGLKKSPGCSWIEVRGKFEIFVAGDASHPQAKRIDSLLTSLRMKMKD